MYIMYNLQPERRTDGSVGKCLIHQLIRVNTHTRGDTLFDTANSV